MPRDASGNYTLPAGNPVIPNTIIATNWANTTMDDIAAALTASLSVNGSVTAAKLATNSVTTIKIADANVTRAKLEVALQNDIIGKNYVINSNFMMWQAATSLVSGTGVRYTSDMSAHNSAGSTYNCARQSVPVGEASLPPGAEYFQRIACTSVAGASNFCSYIIPIEDVNTLNGKEVTVSMYAKVPTGATNIALELSQGFGSGGAPSATVSTPMGLAAAVSGWTRIQKTITLPSTAGKTLGTNNGDSLSIIIWLDAGSTFNTRASNLGQQTITLDLFGIKIEEGPAATDYEIPDAQTEILKCYRYYFASDSNGVTGHILFSGNVTNANVYSASVKFPTTMRIAPSMTFTDLGGSASFPAAGSIIDVSTMCARAIKTASATGNGFYSASYVANARLL